MNHDCRSQSSSFFFTLVLSSIFLLPLLAMDLSAMAKEPTVGSAEQKTARFLESIREQPGLLYAHLRQMPKGGDLHSHLSGAVYAESMIRWAAGDGLCIDQQSLQALDPPCDAPAGRPEAKQAFRDDMLYRRTIDAWSMRNWRNSGQSGHDHFFDTFEKFDKATDNHYGEMLAEVASRAAAGRVSYLELMITPEGDALTRLATRTGWSDDLDRLRSQLQTQGLPDILRAIAKQVDQAEIVMQDQLHCGKEEADSGCGVAIRFLYQVLRGLPREMVFAQMLAGFELAATDSRFVGLNLVMPEDSFVPMADYYLHMRMLEYLHRLFPQVKLTLHGGELAPGLVPPEGLRFHIRDAVRLAHAKRIGHGVDIMQEDDCWPLLREMARTGVLVEILLTSNDLILGVKGKEHPLNTYIRYGVPVALATDDEGVSRSEMTQEFKRAVEDQGLGYLQLKDMSRNSLEYSFVEGRTLWQDRTYARMVTACAKDKPAAKLISDLCRGFLAKNSKARMQWQLEKDFVEFEAKSATWDNP